MAKFCMECGTALPPGCKFCPECGTVNGGAANGGSTYQQYGAPQYGTPQYGTPQYGAPQYGNSYRGGSYNTRPKESRYVWVEEPEWIIKELISKIKIEAIMWLVIACIQAVLGLIYFAIASDSGDEYYTFLGIAIMIVAGMNISFSIKAFTFAKEVYIEPVGVLERYAPIGKPLGSLIYNILFGGLIGVIASIYAFVIRNFVITHEMEFYKIEEDYKTNH